MSILISFLGALIGGAAGFVLGEMTQFWVDGTTFDMRMVSALLGTLIGYFAGHLVARAVVAE